jgi:hypothetical protein
MALRLKPSPFRVAGIGDEETARHVPIHPVLPDLVRLMFTPSPAPAPPRIKNTPRANRVLSPKRRGNAFGWSSWIFQSDPRLTATRPATSGV